MKHKGENQKAQYYFQECLKLFEKIENKWQMAITLNEIAEIYEEEKKIEQAIESYEKMLAICEEIERTNVIMNILEHLVKIYSDLEKPKKAEEYQIKLQTLKNETKDEKS